MDDLFFILDDFQVTQKFVDWLNDQNPHLKFSHNMDTKIIPFLDIEVYISDKLLLGMKLHRKPTDRNVYLQYSSFHPHF